MTAEDNAMNVSELVESIKNLLHGRQVGHRDVHDPEIKSLLKQLATFMG